MGQDNETFAGFGQEAFAFFMKIGFNNAPATMEENRDVFDREVLRPLKQLSAACEQVLFDVDPKMDFRPVMGGTISRIRRDTRYTHDKRPYRDYMWMDFRRKREDFHFGFCFSISPRSSSVFLGMHSSTAQARNALRAFVAHNAAEYNRLYRKLIRNGYALEGRDYKRSMLETDDAAVRAFAQKRWFSFKKGIPLTDTMKPSFTGELQINMRELVPMYQFMRRPLD